MYYRGAQAAIVVFDITNYVRFVWFFCTVLASFLQRLSRLLLKPKNG